MRILLDENMPDGLLTPLRRLGHTAESVGSLRLKGLANTRLYREVAQRYDVFLTKDRAFGARVRTLGADPAVKVIIATIPQAPEAEFVASFMAIFEKTDWSLYPSGSDWPR